MVEGWGGGGGGERDEEILPKDNVGVGREKVTGKGPSGFIFWGPWERGVFLYPPLLVSRKCLLLMCQDSSIFHL